MEHEIIGRPDYSMVRLELSTGDEMQAEAGAMISMDESLEMETDMQGGIMESAKRSVMGGESLFINTFRCNEASGTLDLAPAPPGDVLHLELDGTIGIQRGCFMAASTDVEINSEFGGFKGFFSGMGLGMLRAEGQGDLFLSAFGAIRQKQVQGEYVVDNGHIVAFEDSLEFNIETPSGWKPTLLSGEGVITRFQGTGKVYIQTRNGPSFANWLHPFRPVDSDDD